MPIIPGNISVYGPYTRDDDRQHVIIISKNKVGLEVERRTMSYPKFLMENFLLRELSQEETVDHIDNDFTNNEPLNLRVLDRVEHSTVDVLRAVDITLPCSWCGNDVILSRDQRTNSSKAGPFCSRSCTGKYGAAIANGAKPSERQSYTVTYKRNK